MTREECIKWLKSLKTEIGKSEHGALWHYAEAIDVVIKALLASGDFISRADAIDAFTEDGTWLERQGVASLTMVEAKQRAVDILSVLSSKWGDDK